MTSHSPLPSKPYSDEELLAYAQLHLQHLPEGEGVPRPASDAEAKDFVRLIALLPPAEQIVMIEHRMPNVMASPARLEKAYEEQTGDALGIRGAYMKKPKIRGIDHHAVFWGGMFETRPRQITHHAIGADLTFHHENTHRNDMILGSQPAVIAARIPSQTEFLSANEQWQERTRAYVAKQRERYGDTPMREGEKLYVGAYGLMPHLMCKKKDGEPAYTEDKYPLEAMAEMGTHYNALYNKYGGDIREVNRALDLTYPELLPTYHEKMVVGLEAKAATLYARRNDKLTEAVEYAGRVATRDGVPFDADRALHALRMYYITEGPGKFDRRVTDMRHYVHQDDRPHRHVQSPGSVHEWLRKRSPDNALATSPR